MARTDKKANLLMQAISAAEVAKRNMENALVFLYDAAEVGPVDPSTVKSLPIRKKPPPGPPPPIIKHAIEAIEAAEVAQKAAAKALATLEK